MRLQGFENRCSRFLFSSFFLEQRVPEGCPELPGGPRRVPPPVVESKSLICIQVEIHKGAPGGSQRVLGGSRGGPWTFLRGPGRLLGRPCGRPSAPNATPVQVCAFLQWGSWGLPGGPSGRPWECLGGPWGVPGGHGAVLGKPSGVAGASLGILGAPWEVLGGSWGGPWRLLGQHCGGRSAPNATHSEVSAFHVFR